MVAVDPKDELYRRLHPAAVSGDRVNRAACMTNGQYDNQLSVQFAKVVEFPQACLAGKPTFGLGVITVAEVEELGFDVRPDPLPDDPAHALIIGVTDKIQARRLANKMRILIRPSTDDD